MSNSNAYAYTVTEVDPVYGTDFVLGIFMTMEAAETARKEAAARGREDCDEGHWSGRLERGVYYSITGYQIGKVYR
jgi:hypothetical protein